MYKEDLAVTIKTTVLYYFLNEEMNSLQRNVNVGY